MLLLLFIKKIFDKIIIICEFKGVLVWGFWWPEEKYGEVLAKLTDLGVSFPSP